MPVDSVWERSESRGQSLACWGAVLLQNLPPFLLHSQLALWCQLGPEVLSEGGNIGFVFDCCEPGQALGIIQEKFFVGLVV